MDFEKGIVCKLTGEHATFTDQCNDFNKDEVEAKNLEQAKVNQQIATQHPKAVLDTLDHYTIERMKATQDYLYAILGGLAAALISASLWAAITVATEYQIGFMAIGVGLIVGFAVQFFGAGVDVGFGIIGAVFAVLGCFLGNLFSQIWFIAEFQSLSFIETFQLLDFGTILSVITDSFSVMDLFFYGIAVVEGYKFAFRSPTPYEIEQIKASEDYVPYPANHKLRLPLVIISFVGLSVLYFSLSSKKSGYQTYYYENGSIMSQGNLNEGVVNGEWQYFDQNGNLSLEGVYDNGFEEGQWTWYSGDQVSKIGNYKAGIQHGLWINYYDNGNVLDSGLFDNGRPNGYWINRNIEGQLISEGNFDHSHQEGKWKFYHNNGHIAYEVNFEDKALNGPAKYWYKSGQLARELEYNDGNEKVINNWDVDGNPTVTNGNGVYNLYFDNGILAQKGNVKNGVKTGEWSTYYKNGNVKLIGHYDSENTFVIHSYFDETGNTLIENGSGNIKNLTDGNGTYEEGKIKNGYREGTWQTYSMASGALVAEANYSKGKLNGVYKTYFESGQLEVEGFFDKNKRNGIWSWYYQNGQLETSANYSDDQKDGSQEFYNELGLKVREENYKDGMLI